MNFEEPDKNTDTSDQDHQAESPAHLNRGIEHTIINNIM